MRPRPHTGPVSYTHLANGGIAVLIGLAAGAGNSDLPIAVSVTGTVAVSYTHLDCCVRFGCPAHRSTKGASGGSRYNPVFTPRPPPPEIGRAHV